MSDDQTVILDPNADGVYTVRFRCGRCEDYRWRAVQPGREVRRALAALDRGDETDARVHLKGALADLAHLAQWENA